MKIKILIILCVSLLGCKSSKIENIQYTNNCFYINNGYAFLNFYNSGDQDIYIPKFTIIRNKDLTLINTYYNLKNDTLFIRTLTANDVSISDAINPIITIAKDSIEIKKGKSVKDAFRIKEFFKIIVIKDENETYIMQNCIN